MLINQVIAAAIAFAGLVHLLLVPQQFAHSPAHGLFFAVSGVAEIIWAVLFLRKPNERLYNIGIILAGGLIILWAVTRVLPAPFGHEVEVIDLSGIICKFSELVGLVALVALAAQGKIEGLAKRSFVSLLGEALIVAFFVAFVAYVAGHELEPVMPFLGGVHP